MTKETLFVSEENSAAEGSEMRILAEACNETTRCDVSESSTEEAQGHLPNTNFEASQSLPKESSNNIGVGTRVHGNKPRGIMYARYRGDVKLVSQALRRAEAKIARLKKKLSENALPKNKRFLQENFKKICEDAEFAEPGAVMICDQIKNFKKTGNRWCTQTISNSIIARARGPACYEYMRACEFWNLPSNNTLKDYEGSMKTGEVGVASLVIKRLEMEAKCRNDMQRIGSLILDEMTIAPAEQYDRNNQIYLGKVNVAGITPINEDNLANRTLGFVFSGLSTHYSIPVAFVNKLTGQQLHDLTIHVIKELEKATFKVVRIVADNASINVACFKLLIPNSNLSHVVPHPVQPAVCEDNENESERQLFLSFDYCHILKNVRNQHLDRNFQINGEEISSSYAKRIFEMQKNQLLVPVRNLTQKVVNPNTLERQKVAPAMVIFRQDLTSAIQLHHELGTQGFENVQTTVDFLEKFQKWISINDICNTSTPKPAEPVQRSASSADLQAKPNKDTVRPRSITNSSAEFY